MGLHAYCVVPGPCLPAIAGIDGRPVHGVPLPPVRVWVSEHEQRPAADLERARAHDTVIRSAHDDAVTPVPLRFGAWFADAGALEGALRERAPAWAERLQALRGTVEMGLRVAAGASVESAAPVEAATGTAFMHALLERQRQATRLQARRAEVLAAVRAAVAGLVEGEYVEGEPHGTTLLSVAHLVRRPALTAYQDALAPVHERFAELRFLSTGPWPPYSFVS